MPTPLRLAPFLFALLCFLLPFAEVACENKQQFAGAKNSMKVTGWELLTGNTTDPGKPQKFQSHEPNYLLVATMALLVLGLLAVASNGTRWLAVLCAVAASGCLFYLSYNLKENLLPSQAGSEKTTAKSSGADFSLSDFDKLGQDLVLKSLTIKPEPGLFACIGCTVLAAVFAGLPRGGSQSAKLNFPS
jgi:hypothetical protein